MIDTLHWLAVVPVDELEAAMPAFGLLALCGIAYLYCLCRWGEYNNSIPVRVRA